MSRQFRLHGPYASEVRDLAYPGCMSR